MYNKQKGRYHTMDNGASSYRRYLDGETEAFDEIVISLYDPLVLFLCRYVKDHHTAEDIAMDVFADLVVHKHRYNFRVSLKTYLFMLGKSRALNYLKRRQRIADVPIEELPLQGEEPSAEAQYAIDQRKKALHAAMAELPEDMAEALYLMYFEDLSYEEIARVMKRPKKQVDNLLYRGTQRLRAILEEGGIEP